MFGKLFWSFIATVLCAIPIWLYMLARWLLDPQGFLAEFLVLGLGVYVLGSIQLFLFIVWLYILLIIWSGAHRPGVRRF
jgi:hypothetical protein